MDIYNVVSSKTLALFCFTTYEFNDVTSSNKLTERIKCNIIYFKISEKFKGRKIPNSYSLVKAIHLEEINHRIL